jgi:hypothetical protein
MAMEKTDFIKILNKIDMDSRKMVFTFKRDLIEVVLIFVDLTKMVTKKTDFTNQLIEIGKVTLQILVLIYIARLLPRMRLRSPIPMMHRNHS